MDTDNEPVEFWLVLTRRYSYRTLLSKIQVRHKYVIQVRHQVRHPGMSSSKIQVRYQVEYYYN